MRRFELVEGKSAKFWEIDVDGKTVKTHWGRLGAPSGQHQEKKFADAAAATAQAEKQVKEKLDKAAAKSAPKPAAKSARLSSRGFSFSVEQDRLYAQAWPHMCRLTDETPSEKEIVKAVEGELHASDPFFGVEVPREVARRFVRAMKFPRGDSEREDELKDPAAIDWVTMAAVIKRLCPSMEEIYDFRVRDAIFLCEAFLGTATVANALSERFAVAMSTPRLWESRDNGHDHAFDLASAMGDMRWRARSSPTRKRSRCAPSRSSWSAAIARRCASASPRTARRGTGAIRRASSTSPARSCSSNAISRRCCASRRGGRNGSSRSTAPSSIRRLRAS
jgi:predicted DNA-binding WGR domain protein